MEFERVSVTAKRYGVSAQTVYNWLIGGLIAGEQDPVTKAWKVVQGAKYRKPEVADTVETPEEIIRVMEDVGL